MVNHVQPRSHFQYTKLRFINAVFDLVLKRNRNGLHDEIS